MVRPLLKGTQSRYFGLLPLNGRYRLINDDEKLKLNCSLKDALNVTLLIKFGKWQHVAIALYPFTLLIFFFKILEYDNPKFSAVLPWNILSIPLSFDFVN